MKIQVLIENTSVSEQLKSEHGLSILIETGRHRILFDTGASGAFADNAALMGVDLGTVDMAVLSHGHYDHGGGIEHFLQLNDHAPVWVNGHAFEPHYNANGKNIGLPPTLCSHARIRTVPSPVYHLADGIALYAADCIPQTHAAEGSGMTTLVNGERVADDFCHEQYLLVEEAGKRILFSGCSHRGVLNIAGYFKADVLVGGFHYMKCDSAADAPRLEQAAQQLLTLPTTYYTGHCTGDFAFNTMQPIMGTRLRALYTGFECVF